MLVWTRSAAISSSYKSILKATSLLGSASLGKVFLGLVRAKVAAILLGPTGIGLIGLYQSLISAAVPVVSLGIGDTANREISRAIARDDYNGVGAARWTLVFTSLLLATCGGFLFWVFRSDIANLVVGIHGRAEDVAWLGLGVACSVAAAAQIALMSGLGRISEIARSSIYSGFIGTISGVAILVAFGSSGIVAFVLSVPVASYLVGRLFINRLPKDLSSRYPGRALGSEVAGLLKLGLVFMWSGLILHGVLLIVRTFVQDQLGLDALGVFQAAWIISMVYVGLVLGAMGTDYLPRLSASLQNNGDVNRLINEQTEVALLLMGPVVLTVLILAPWLLEFLYTKEFAVGAKLLRWQAIGDVLKVASWPLGYALLSTGDGRRFFIVQTCVVLTYLLVIVLGLDRLGLEAAGVGFFAMYAVGLPMNYFFVRNSTGFIWSRNVRTYLATLFLSALAIMLLTAWSEIAALLIGLFIVLSISAFSLLRLSRMVPLSDHAKQLAKSSRTFLSRLGAWRE